MANFSWTCPYCNKLSIISGYNHNKSYSEFTLDNVEGPRIVGNYFTVCPNPECKKFTLEVELHTAVQSGNYYSKGQPLKLWRLIPDSNASTFPDYIPTALKEDYYEACLIRDLSPKASATLSRRCLQGMIRDFWNVSERTLYLEIQAIEENLDPVTWNAINAVRQVGNIGAHMERDINSIVEVEPDEAQLLIELIETLLKEWYVARHERENRMRKLTELAASKEEVRRS